MKVRRGPPLSLACVTVLHGINHSYSIVLSPLNTELQSFFGAADISAVTMLKTTYLAVYAASNLVFGFLTRRFSARRMLAFGAFLNAGAVASFALVGRDDLPWMHLLWALAAVGGGAYHPVANVLITRLYPGRKGWALGITGIGASAGFTFGPALTGVLTKGFGLTWQGVAVGIAVAGFGVALATLFTVTDLPRLEGLGPEPSREKRPRGEAPLRPGCAVFTAFLVLVVLAAGLREVSTWSVMDIADFYLAKAFSGEAATSWYLMLMFAPGMLVQPLAGMLSDRTGRRRLAAAALALHALGAVSIGLVSRSFLFAPFLLMGIGQAASVPTIEAVVADHTTARNRGLVFGCLVTAGLGLGAMGPLFSGLLIDGLGKTLFAYRLNLFLLFCVTLAGAVFMTLSGLLLKRGPAGKRTDTV